MELKMRILGCIGTILVISLFHVASNAESLTVTPAKIFLDKSEYSVGEQPIVTVSDSYSDFDPNAIDTIVVVVKAKVTKATVGTTIATVTIQETGPDTRIFSGVLPAISAKDTFNDAAQQENTWLEVSYTLESTYNNVYALLLRPEKEPSYYPKDSDGDGITDDKDKCPSEAETYNGYEDTDGCYDVTGDEPATSQSGPGLASPPKPDCGGKYFTSATQFPSGSCHHDRFQKRYFSFIFENEEYFAVVESMWDTGYGYYDLELIGDEVVLSVQQDTNYDLYVYDLERSLVGESHASNGQTDGVRIYYIPPPQTKGFSSKFDGRYEVTFSYSADYGEGPAGGKMVLYFDVKNGIVSHPQNVFSGNIYDDGAVDVTYSECAKFTYDNSAGIVTGSLSEYGYGDGTFSCGSALYGYWKAARIDEGYKPPPATTLTPKPIPTTGYTLYENSKYGFSIEYPKGWQIDEDLYQPSSAFVSIVKFSPDLEEDDVYIKIMMAQPLPPIEEVESRLNAIVDGMQKSCSPANPTYDDDGEVIYCSDLSGVDAGVDYIGGKKVLYIIYEYTVMWEDDDEEFFYDGIFIMYPDNDRTFLIELRKLQGDDRYREGLGHSAESFRTSDSEYVESITPKPMPKPQPTPSPIYEAEISVSTDKRSYNFGNTVTVGADLSDSGYGTNIAVSVTDPTGSNIVSRTITTDSEGYADLQFKVPEGSKTGTYQVVVTASIDGNTYQDSTEFVVQSLATQVSIISIEATDQQGNPVSTFSRGTNGFVKIVLGTESNTPSLTSVNLFGSDLTSLGINSLKTTLTSGESEILLSFFIPQDSVIGTADIYANVFSDWPSRGGVPLTREGSYPVRIQ